MEENFVLVPYRILKRKDISEKAKLLYGFVAGFKSGDCIASNEFISKITGASVRKIQRGLKELDDKGLIFRKMVMENNEVVGRIIYIKNPRKRKKKDEQL